MVPTPIPYRSSRLLLPLFSAVAHHVASYFPASVDDAAAHTHVLAKRGMSTTHIVFAVLIPVLVLLSGLFAGLTLGYMSLDETQLNVLSISGTPQQRQYAKKIIPIRKDGHLLLVTLLLANMITNETLPVISAPVLGGGVQSVVVSTVLIVIFSEIIPQTVMTRYGLYFGAKMAWLVRVLIIVLGVVAWPVAKLLELILGPHHGIIYRRAELKELVAMHANTGHLGGDLKKDTVTIIGGALDLQEKIVRQAMTPINDVFMLSVDAKLDYETLRKVCVTGHSRIPVYEEVEVPVPQLLAANEFSDLLKDDSGMATSMTPGPKGTVKVKKIIGILLVKQCVLLDPADAVPVRKIPLNKVPFVPNNEPLLGILDKFQEGRSHMAIVSRFSVDRAASVKQAVKRGLTQRLLDRVGMGDSDSSSESSSDESDEERQSGQPRPRFKDRAKSWRKRHNKGGENSSQNSNEETLREETQSSHSPKPDEEETQRKVKNRGRSKRKGRPADLEMGVMQSQDEQKQRKGSLSLPKVAGFSPREQSMPADAVLAKDSAKEFLQTVDPAIMPLGIITLEDVLEELIGEEIYDEFDPQGHPDLSFAPERVPKSPPALRRRRSDPALPIRASGHAAGDKATAKPPVPASSASAKPLSIPTLKALNLKNLGFARSRSAPPSPRDDTRKDGNATPASIPEGAVSEPPPPTVHFESPPVSPDEGPAGPSGEQSTVNLSDQPTIAVTPPPTSLPQSPANSSTAVDAAQRTQNSIAPRPVAPQALAASSSSRSSSPSLEQAILIERMRRAAGGVAGATGPKGARFKSSPLTGDRGGVVVAETVKRHPLGEPAEIEKPEDSRVAGREDVSAVRISGEMEKQGPDKEASIL